MPDIIDGTNACANTPPISEKTNSYLYKVGYLELSSYCKGLSLSLYEVAHMLDMGNMPKVCECINSMGLGLGFVLEDIQDIDRRLNTG